MKPGDLIMVWGGTQPRATLYEDNFLYHEVAVARGTLGFVINGPLVTRDRLDGYVKVMLYTCPDHPVYADELTHFLGSFELVTGYLINHSNGIS